MSDRGRAGRSAPSRGTGRDTTRTQASGAAARRAAGGSAARSTGRSAGQVPATRSTGQAGLPVARERGRSVAALSRGSTPASPRARSAAGKAPRTSAPRFAARGRRRRQRRVVVVLVALAGGLGLGWLVFASPLLTVRDVQVRGVHRLSAADIERVASGQVGRSMALVSRQAVVDGVVDLRLVRAARVDRRWPSTLVVTVTEREPIVGVPAAGGRVDLVDGDGVVVETVARVPADLPLVEVDVRRAGAESLRAARAVADVVPPTVRPGLRKIRATSPDAVSFVLADGSTVIWGSAQDGDRKVAALLAVHPKPTKHPEVIDVSAPDAPAVTTR